VADRDQLIDDLARSVGIELGYRGIDGSWRAASPDTRRALLGAMGYDIDSAAALADALALETECHWRRRMAATIVTRAGGVATPEILLAVKEREADATLRWEIELERGGKLSGEAPATTLPALENRMVAGERVTQCRLRLPADLPFGYHRLHIALGEANDAASLAVAPLSAYLPHWLGRGERHWGVASPLYALRSPEDWGIGDFGDLERLGRWAQPAGASLIGLNPLHAPLAGDAAEDNPYYPSSRLFLNPLHIDVAAAMASERGAATIGAAAAGWIAAAQQAPLIDYPTVRRAKEETLRALHRRAGAPRQGGTVSPALRNFALFNALHEALAPLRWHAWPEALRRPDAPGIAAFAAEHAEAIDYHVFIQEIAERQLAAACAGTDLGLYLDFAVGFHPDGAEAWANQDAYVVGARIGAPPDPFSPTGQDWGMPPAHPGAMRRDGYAPWVAALRANMRHARALRIDHAMALQRLYWIPPGAPASEGAYVRYPLDDLLGIVALESQRARCLVIGEDLGTVPEGFRERLGEAGVLSYRVLLFEQEAGGVFRPPREYPRLAAATASTHDLPTVLGWCEGSDIELRAALRLIDAGQAERERGQRHAERVRLAQALAEQKLLRDEEELLAFARSEPDRLIAAVELYLARTPSALLLVNLGDLLAESEQQNLPGTLDQYPNWRRRMAVPIAALAGLPSLQRLAALIETARRGR
jgi:4-alpha-glucanotransferase